MKKEIFLSFNPKYFNPILYGVKKYEYRKRFCNEKTRAYLYLSGKVRKVVGIMELDEPIRLDKVRDKYLNHYEILLRIDEYIEQGDINAVPIVSLALFKTPVTLDMIREKLNGFMPPQMYYLLENNQRLHHYLDSFELGEKIFVHDHRRIYDNNIAVSCSSMEASEEFKNLEAEYANNETYRNAKYKS